ncbi:MAG: hypothetical protein Q9173_000359 [Seirophora scorigena]
MGGDLNLKKSWHPVLMSNQRRVWEEENKALEERKRIEQMMKERQEERQIQELQEMQEAAGGKKRLNRVDWMYSGPSAGQVGTTEEMEGYLLGKRRVDGLLKGTENKNLEKAASEDSFMALQKANTVRDTASKIREDPMLAIKKQEQAAYEALMNDPVKRRLLLKAAGGDVGGTEASEIPASRTRSGKTPRQLQAEAVRGQGWIRPKGPTSKKIGFLGLFKVGFAIPPGTTLSSSATKPVTVTLPSPTFGSVMSSTVQLSLPSTKVAVTLRETAAISGKNPPPSPRQDMDDRAAKLAAMQQNASDLDLDREKRMAAIAENEAAEREADEAARARSAKYGGRGNFVNGLNRKADIFVDGVHIELSLWDTAGQEEFDRLRSLSYDDTHTILLCFSVDSKDSLENVESKWVGEIAENCQGVKLVLVALKCDLRASSDDEDDGVDEDLSQPRKEKDMIDYKEGLEVARRIQALRYLGIIDSLLAERFSPQLLMSLTECSAKRNRGVNEAFTEAARVALSVKTGASSSSSKCTVM